MADVLPPFEASSHRRLDSTLTDEPLVNMSTVFITGQQDTFKPLMALALSLVDGSKLLMIGWDGGHPVPKSAAKSSRSKVARQVKTVVKGSRVQ